MIQIDTNHKKLKRKSTPTTRGIQYDTNEKLPDANLTR